MNIYLRWLPTFKNIAMNSITILQLRTVAQCDVKKTIIISFMHQRLFDFIPLQQSPFPFKMSKNLEKQSNFFR